VEQLNFRSQIWASKVDPDLLLRIVRFLGQIAHVNVVDCGILRGKYCQLRELVTVERLAIRAGTRLDIPASVNLVREHLTFVPCEPK
jgi:hypothetical protein